MPMGGKKVFTVSTLAVEWIEIRRQVIGMEAAAVSTLAVEWIEIR